MENKIRNSTVAFAGLKLSQQLASDLESVVLDNTTTDYMLYGAGQVCKVGAAAAGAYAIDSVVETVETVALPKYLRGLVPLAAATLGVAAVINYSGNNFGIQENIGLLETTGQLFRHYHESVLTALSDPLNVDARYLTGALLTLKSGFRFIGNLGGKIKELSDKKRHKERTKTQSRGDE
tara:strand:- start:3320 stop:3856 length:537 start_codon:yes stop_codon:yes gene_type:complete